MANGGWKIARSRSGAQLPLALLAALAIALILIGKAQSNLFDRARANVSDWAAPALEVVRAPLGGVDRWLGSIGDMFNVYKENLKLKEENARLRQWQNVAVVLDTRVKRYQLLLHAVPDPTLSSVMARVIGRSNRPFLQTMILDAGSAHLPARMRSSRARNASASTPSTPPAMPGSRPSRRFHPSPSKAPRWTRCSDRCAASSPST